MLESILSLNSMSSAEIEEYRGRTVGFLRKIGSYFEEAEDLTQDAFVNVLRQYGLTASHRALPTLLGRVAKNKLIDASKRANTASNHKGEVYFSTDQVVYNDGPKNLITEEKRARITWAVDQLPPRQREVFLLYARDDMTESKIATELEIAVGTVKNHRFKAIHRLRELLVDV